MVERTVSAPAQSETAMATREPTREEAPYARPPVDIYEDSGGLVVVADLPGVESDHLDVRVERGFLTIQAQAKHVESGEPVIREYALTGFFRQFQLSEEIDTAKIEAYLKNGVLHMRLPLAEHARPRRIEVRAS